MSWLKRLAKNSLKKTGYQIRRVRPTASTRPPETRLTPYHAAILALFSHQPRLHIVVIGANDGKHNDPLYPLLTGEIVERTQITLIEPQSKLLPHLKENYAFHPDCRFINHAIGPGPSLNLYSIREDCWQRMQPLYARGWPSYRAPTGITSSDRESVASWARRFLKEDEEVEDFIEKETVESMSLHHALQTNDVSSVVDILQIDAEGYDDEVIYSCDIARALPAIIHFESKLINGERLSSLMDYLKANGYTSRPVGGDTLCFRRQPA